MPTNFDFFTETAVQVEPVLAIDQNPNSNKVSTSWRYINR